jgi:hypothetical protein
VKKSIGKTTVGYTFIGFFWGGRGANKTTHRRIADNQKWEVDEHAKGRLSADGRVRRQKRHCRLCLLNDTTPHELRCLLIGSVNVRQRPNRVVYTSTRFSEEDRGVCQ